MAVRYLAARRGGRLPVITIISIGAVAAGVASLVIALAVTSGFRDLLQSSLLGATPHVSLMRTNGEGIANWREIVATAEHTPGVIAAAPAVYGQMLITSGRRSEGVVLKGLDPPLERHVN